MAVLREDGIIKARTSIRIVRGSYYINSSTLNENSVNIRLALSHNLTNYDTVRVNKDVLARESKSLVLEVIIVLNSSQLRPSRTRRITYKPS